MKTIQRRQQSQETNVRFSWVFLRTISREFAEFVKKIEEEKGDWQPSPRLVLNLSLAICQRALAASRSGSVFHRSLRALARNCSGKHACDKITGRRKRWRAFL